MSGKKGKKTKAKTIPLQEFLGDTPAVTPIQKFKSWADEDEDDSVYSARPKDPVILPTAPRAARDMVFSENNLPTHPPWVAYISNLPYDVDEEDLHEFFQDMKVVSMRLPKDANKFKGYGYVEFEDKQSLIDSLMMVDTNLKSRRVRIEVSNSSNDDRRGRMGRMGDSRREYSPERTGGDWRMARSDDPPRMDDDREDRGGFRSRGFERRDDMRGDRDSGFEDAKPGNWRDAPREALPDRPRPSFRDSRPGGDDRERMGSSRFSDRPMRGRDGSRERDGERGGGFGPRRYYNDDPDKDRDRWSSLRSQPREPLEPRDSSSAAPPPSESSAPMTRPKLELKPRSKPIEAEATDKSEEKSDSNSQDKPVSAPAPVAAANIFGAARPVDTAAREREIEERLAKTAEERSKEAGSREGTWGRRNGEGRYEQERSRPTWRSRAADPNDQNSKDLKSSRDSSKPRSQRSDSRGSSSSRGATAPVRGSPKEDSEPPTEEPEKEKKKVELTEEEELSRMPKAREDQSPNFVASNKYSMLPDDVDPDNIEE